MSEQVENPKPIETSCIRLLTTDQQQTFVNSAIEAGLNAVNLICVDCNGGIGAIVIKNRETSPSPGIKLFPRGCTKFQ